MTKDLIPGSAARDETGLDPRGHNGPAYAQGNAALPVIPLHDATHGCNVLALLCEMPVDAVRDAVASRRLHTWGLLDGGDADAAMPLQLSGWLSATDQFADWIEPSYASDTDIFKALWQAQVSLMASR